VVCVSTVAIHELWYGVAKSARRDYNTERVQRFSRALSACLPFDEADARAAGEVRALLEQERRPIGRTTRSWPGRRCGAASRWSPPTSASSSGSTPDVGRLVEGPMKAAFAYTLDPRGSTTDETEPLRYGFRAWPRWPPPPAPSHRRRCEYVKYELAAARLGHPGERHHHPGALRLAHHHRRQATGKAREGVGHQVPGTGRSEEGDRRRPQLQEPHRPASPAKYVGLFAKFPTSLIGHDGEIIYRRRTTVTTKRKSASSSEEGENITEAQVKDQSSRHRPARRERARVAEAGPAVVPRQGRRHLRPWPGARHQRGLHQLK